MFRPMALTVLFALGTALVLTFTWVPAMGGLVIGRASHEDPKFVPLASQPVSARSRVAAPSLEARGARRGGAAGGRRGSRHHARRASSCRGSRKATSRSRSRDRPASPSRSRFGARPRWRQALMKFPEVVARRDPHREPRRRNRRDGSSEQSDVFVIFKPRSEWRSAHDAASFANKFDAELKQGAAWNGLQLHAADRNAGARADRRREGRRRHQGLRRRSRHFATSRRRGRARHRRDARRRRYSRRADQRPQHADAAPQHTPDRSARRREPRPSRLHRDHAHRSQRRPSDRRRAALRHRDSRGESPDRGRRSDPAGEAAPGRRAFGSARRRRRRLGERRSRSGEPGAGTSARDGRSQRARA